MISRRDVFKHAGALALASGIPRLVFATADTDALFVLVILRGAVDGLALAAPYGDGNYQQVRGELALPDSLKLDGMFGLHPSLTGIHNRYKDGEALLAHAVASPYRKRSHFDGQDVLENGGDSVGALRDGWLNRALKPLGGSLGNESAIAMAQNTPLVLRGDNSVTSWAPSQLPDADDSTLHRLQDLYADDEFFSTRLAQALKSQEIAREMGGMTAARNRGSDLKQFRSVAASTARFLTAPNGPRVAVIELGGWDTHANQGSSTGALANRLAGLDEGVDALRKELGNRWDRTVIAITTEFGRTVHVNGTRGTDHGTATAALLVGGAVDGGQIIADWPGLRDGDLYKGRDLRPTTDVRSLFKSVLVEHMALDESFVERDVFPDSTGAKVISNLIRS